MLHDCSDCSVKCFSSVGKASIISFFLLLFKSAVQSVMSIICVAETAENIGYSCNLLREEMNEVFVVSGHTLEDVRQELRSAEDFFSV